MKQHSQVLSFARDVGLRSSSFQSRLIKEAWETLGRWRVCCKAPVNGSSPTHSLYPGTYFYVPLCSCRKPFQAPQNPNRPCIMYLRHVMMAPRFEPKSMTSPCFTF